MKLRDHYDWVVLGDHPAALLSASLAARIGLSVLILPLEPSFRLLLSRSGQCLDPESNFFIDLGERAGMSGLQRLCLSKVGLVPTEADQIRLSSGVAQVVTPETRIQFDPELNRFSAEISRELGLQAAAELGLASALERVGGEVMQHWNGLPERFTLPVDQAKRRPKATESIPHLFKRLGKTLGLESTAEREWLRTGAKASGLGARLGRPEVREILAGFVYGATSAEVSDPPLDDALHVMALARAGATFRGGMSAYRDFLLRLAQRLGAHAPPKSECQRIFVERGRFVGIQISNRGSMNSVTGGVLGCSLESARERISGGGKSWFGGLRASPPPKGWKFTIALTIHAEAIPPGMSSRLVWQEADAPALELEVVDPADYGLRQPDKRLVFARTMMPFTEESLSPAYQRMRAARMLRQVMELFPFLEYHVARIYPDFRGRSGVPEDSFAELTEVYGFESVKEIPENIRCHSGKGTGSRTGIEGLFVASGESFPELGTLGGTVAALESIAWLAHRSGLPGPLA